MSTIAPENEKLRELEDDIRRAWLGYHDQILDLTGSEYEQIEPEAWDTLQTELCRVERRRRILIVANA